MAYTGRCWYCGSEDVEDYSDGSHECLECGMTWGKHQYVQRHVKLQRYSKTYSHAREKQKFERTQRPYCEKWSNRTPKSSFTDTNIKNKDKKWYEYEVKVSDGCAIPAVLYFIIAIVVYGFAGTMLYIACSD